jgi:hypothetical protein
VTFNASHAGLVVVFGGRQESWSPEISCPFPRNLDSEYEGMIYRTTKNKDTSKYIYGVTVTENNLTYENGSDLPLNMSINYAGLPIFKLG